MPSPTWRAGPTRCFEGHRSARRGIRARRSSLGGPRPAVPLLLSCPSLQLLGRGGGSHLEPAPDPEQRVSPERHLSCPARLLPEHLPLLSCRRGSRMCPPDGGEARDLP